MHTHRAVKIRELFLTFAKRQLTNCGDVHKKTKRYLKQGIHADFLGVVTCFGSTHVKVIL